MDSCIRNKFNRNVFYSITFKGGDMYLIELRENSTDKRIYFQKDMNDLNGEFNPYGWSDGNFSCDCNRGLIFDGRDIPCSDGLFSVNIYNILTGKLMYSEF